MYIGPRARDEDGEWCVQPTPSWDNTISFTYDDAEEYFTQSPLHRRIWERIRSGDVQGSDPVTVRVTTKLTRLIDQLPPGECLRFAFTKGLLIGKESDRKVYVESR
jgi:hypothetical protein